MNSKNRVVVTGVGIIAPNGRDRKEYSNSLREGRSGIRAFEKLRELGFACQVGGIPSDLDALIREKISEEILPTLNSGMIYGLLAGIEAWMDSGFSYSPNRMDSAVDWETGAIIGTGAGGVDTLGDWVIPQVNAGKVRRLGSSCVERTMSSAVSARLGGILGLGGQTTTNSSACTTGTEAIIDGYRRIRSGQSKRFLAGGAEGSSHYIWAGFDAMRVLAKDYNDRPELASRPLSQSACGFVPSSGAGILMLESLDSALERKAKIYAEIIGGHVNSGGQRNGGSMTAPSQEGVIRCIRAAIHEAGIQPREIDLINGHLTATMADPIEVQNWQRALERKTDDFPWIQSTKSMIGHGLGAAGGMEAVASVLQIHEGFIHPSLNCNDLKDELREFRDRIPHTTVDRSPLIVAKSSFGFGDVNACILFKKFTQTEW